MKTNRECVIWAVDPFAADLRSQTSAIWAMNPLGGKAIQPVYAWNELPIGTAGTTAKIRATADAILRQWAAPLLEAELLPLQVLSSGGSRSAERAESVVAYAKRKGATLIVASHHTRTGLKRWFSGSFCESLSLVSPIPVLIAPPQTKAPKARQPILFPTDFSEASLRAFDAVVAFARARNLPVTIFHKVEYPVYPPSEFVYAAAGEIVKTEREIARSMRASAEKLAEKARARGVSAKVLVDARPGLPTLLSVLAHAKKGYSLVAMAAHSGLLSRILLGSTSRFLIRECPAPIWIMHPGKARSVRPPAL